MPLAALAAHLDEAATLLRGPSYVRAYVSSTFFDDLAELLSSSGAVLRTTPLSANPSEWPSTLAQLSMSELQRVTPHMGTLLTLCSFGLGTVLWVASLAFPRLRAPRREFWLVRLVLVRGMGLIYLAAFATSAAQSRALFGTLGLSPTLSTPSGRPSPAFDALGRSDLALEAVSWLGVLFSLLVLRGTVQWGALLLALWVLYLSIVNLGARVVLGYGWEWATCEVGLLVIFLCPEWPCTSGFPRALPPPRLVLWLLRWYVFRLLLGAGQSKLGARSSACWAALTCTQTHYFTQPMPNALAWAAHRLPPSAHRAEVAITFVEQLALPFLVLAPFRAAQIFACIAELCLQIAIVGTGNCTAPTPRAHSRPRAPLPTASAAPDRARRSRPRAPLCGACRRVDQFCGRTPRTRAARRPAARAAALWNWSSSR